MGVKDLWPILEPVKQTLDLDDLSGKTLAIDLGFWTCQMNSAVDAHVANQHKIYLKNLFFRINALLKRNINPIFVSEGKPPELKHETIRSRLNAANINSSSCPQNSNDVKNGKCLNRTRFNILLNKSCQLIKLMGLQCYVSDGEAEAFCATLNEKGVVDGVITDDNDAFLYGALKVYKNFNLDGKKPTIDCYSMADIETNLKLGRSKLIALGLLVGCDYCPKGVPGIGKERALKFCQQFPCAKDILERLKSWPDSLISVDAELYEYESNIKCKALQIHSFPNCNIIEEYTRPRHVLQTKTLPLSFTPLFLFLSKNLEWPNEYIVEKIVPIFTLKYLNEKAKNGRDHRMEVVKLVKKRVLQSKTCFEVQWSKFEEDIWTEQDVYVTTENEQLLKLAYPEMVDAFENVIALKKGVKKKRIKSSKQLNNKQEDKEKISLEQEKSQGKVENCNIDLMKTLNLDDCHSINGEENTSNDGTLQQIPFIKPKFSFKKFVPKLTNAQGDKEKDLQNKELLASKKDNPSVNSVKENLNVVAPQENSNSPLPFKERVMKKLLNRKNELLILND